MQTDNFIGACDNCVTPVMNNEDVLVEKLEIQDTGLLS